MLKRLGCAALAMVLFIGCGGVRPTPFSEKVRPLGLAMEKAVQTKNKAEIQKVVDLAEKRNDVRSEELAVFKGVKEYTEQDNWEAAAALIAKSNELQD